MTVSPMAPVATTGRGAQARARILTRTETRLSALLTAEHALWAGVDARATAPVDSVGQLVRAGGKRLRPSFCAAGFLAAGGDPTDARVVEAAAAVELLHAFALIHDDVIDASPLRRGEPTTQVRAMEQHRTLGWRGEARRYGEGVAVLAGDLAFSYAMRLAQELPTQARRVWGELVTEMIVGQHLDVAVAAEGIADPRLSEYIANAKSGRYSIRRPLELGAAIVGNTTLAATFEEYGTALGEAFQLRDDLIDAFGDANVAGKPVGADAENNKMTLLTSLAVRRSERVRELVAAGGDEAVLRAEMAAIDVRAEIERRIDALVARAREALAAAPLPQEWREELSAMAVAVAYRDK
ncbi:polyprenyl synthetase family protein [Streptomyces zagrosensis]|uniref:Geranylgeranyl diphosphate synthase type I n=1 Tax=Streptomyces zagrosensis TaxID=1042984 RepID=A0A7W9V1F9_9ACTN|nr:polyprenyl synthetase family protein [Streptomyces zagrosensis]MBB5937739.1 geranylgeranyl diphosphate synthase type I [Streptomyces zagrosensis]